jgi:2-phosphoglycerate kinase
LVQPFTGVDVRGVSGIAVFVGYGTSLTEMIASDRLKEVYRTP